MMLLTTWHCHTNVVLCWNILITLYICHYKICSVLQSNYLHPAYTCQTLILAQVHLLHTHQNKVMCYSHCVCFEWLEHLAIEIKIVHLTALHIKLHGVTCTLRLVFPARVFMTFEASVKYTRLKGIHSNPLQFAEINHHVYSNHRLDTLLQKRGWLITKN